MNKDLLSLISLHDIKAIVFDFDGVLVESNNIKTEAFYELYQSYGEDIAKRVVEYHLHHEGVSRFEKFNYFHEEFLSRKLSQQEHNTLSEAFSLKVKQKIINANPVQGVEKFVTYCASAAIPMFVASATPQNELQEILLGRSWNVFFKNIYGAPQKKADAIADILLQYKIKSQHTLMIGDALSDYEAALKNNINFCARITGQNKKIFNNIKCLKISSFD